jgi:hypothetical protein
MPRYLAGRLVFFDVILKGNALQILKEVNSATPCLSSFGHFVEDIKLGLGSMRTFNFAHVKREANLATHGLAWEATTHVVDFTWMKEIFDVIYDIVCKEVNISTSFIDEILFQKKDP